MFLQQGYEATSMDAISDAMGLSRSSFYVCFGSKHALLVAAVRRYADDRYATLAERVAACADPREAVRAMLAVIANVQGVAGAAFSSMHWPSSHRAKPSSSRLRRCTRRASAS